MRPGVATGCGVALLAATIAVKAQQPPAPQRTMIPMAASSILLNPDEAYGMYVSMPAAVERILSKTTFTVDQDKTKPSGKELLVIAPTLQEAPAANDYITVVGEVFRFDPDEVAKRAKGYTLDLTPDLVEQFRSKPAVLATSVISPKLTDIARRPPPPLTPEELAFDKTMKTVQATVTALRTSLEETNAADAKTHTATLKNAFVETQLFFSKRKTEDAAGWAAEAAKHVDGVASAAAGAKWDEAQKSVAALQAMCAQCHTAHRERGEDGSFRVRGSR
jgi:hypothetical protein